MKKFLLSALLVASSAAIASAAVTPDPCDRIDAYYGPDVFKSILVDDIRTIKYEGDPVSGYTVILIETDDDLVRIPIDSLHRLVYSAIDGTAHEIKPVDTEHASFRMLFNHNKPDEPDAIDPNKPYGWRGAHAGEPVFYLLNPEKGFTCEHTITGAYSGKQYYPGIRNFVTVVPAETTASLGIGIDCLMYNMPFEPTVMTLSVTELDSYKDLDILGTYYGGQISTHGKHLRTSTSAELSYTLKANTTFTFTSSEDEPIQLTDCYTYDAEKGSIVNVPDPNDVNSHPDDLVVRWGISARFLQPGFLAIEAKYIPDPVSSNNRFYFASASPCSFTLADGDSTAYRQLLEVLPESGSPVYYYLEGRGYSITPATVEFAQGNTIASPSIAYIDVNGERKARYSLVEGSDPVITLRGDEAGQYAYTGTGSHSQLILDGFGSATIDGVTCPYTLAAGLVVLSLPSGDLEIIIDTVAKTYAEKAKAQWEGAKMFSTSKAVGSYMGQAEAPNCSVTLLLDQNYNGTANPGNAVVKISVPRSDYYQPLEIQGSGAEYVYDPDARTITVSNLKTYLWTGSEWKYSGVNLTFHLSDDLKSIWLGSEVIGEKFWGTKRDGSYILTGENCILYADGKEPETQTPDPALDITGTYSGSPNISLYGSERPAEATLSISDSEATFSVQIMGMSVLNSTVSYTFEDNTLTLKGVTVGNGDGYSGITESADIVFTYADGVLTGSGSYSGSSSSTAAMVVLLDGAQFTK